MNPRGLWGISGLNATDGRLFLGYLKSHAIFISEVSSEAIHRLQISFFDLFLVSSTKE